MNMNLLGDDELSVILSRLSPDGRKSASLVSKRWWVMESLSRSSLRVLGLDVHLPRLLARYPNLKTFETPLGISKGDLALVGQSCPKLETFILDFISIPEVVGIEGLGAIGMTGDTEDDEPDVSPSVETQLWEKILVAKQVGDEGLCALANGCPKLSKIVIRRRWVGFLGVVSLLTSAALNLTHLELAHCCLVNDQALEAIEAARCPISVLILQGCAVTDAGLRVLARACCSKTIEQLHLSDCREITDDGLRALAEASCSKTIKLLALSCCDAITDYGVSHLCKMHVLEELDSTYCDKLTDIGGQAISAIPTLKKLSLASSSFSLTERTIVSVAKKCKNLEELIVVSGVVVTTASVDAFLGHKCLRSLHIAFCLSDDFNGSVFESLALQCPSLVSIVVDEGRREMLLQQMQEATVNRYLEFID